MGSPDIIDFGAWIRVHDDTLAASLEVGMIGSLDTKGARCGKVIVVWKADVKSLEVLYEYLRTLMKTRKSTGTLNFAAVHDTSPPTSCQHAV
jgi:hypothetical protein